MRWGALFLVLAAVNVYVFFFRQGSPLDKSLKAGAIAGKKLRGAKKGGGAGDGSANAPAGDKPLVKSTSAALQPPEDGTLVVRGKMKGHNGLFAALLSLKLDKKDVAATVKALRGKLDMRALKPYHTFEARIDPTSKQLLRFSYRVSKLLSAVVVRKKDGTLAGRRVAADLRTRVRRFTGRISGSLGASIAKAGEKSSLASRLLLLFSWDINWYTDPRPGDVFKIIVEKQYLQGKFYRYGRILAAEYSGKVGRYRAFFYKKNKRDRGDYYNLRGRRIRRQFIKTPLYHYRRISSRFQRKRFHPVLKRRKRHNGVDFAAPPGTPVVAAADGIVLSARRQGGAGRAIVLKHKGHLVTQYFHLLRFARGVRAGRKVRQRQVIGYVGSTGLATGPHLHYGVKRRGRYIDPFKMYIAPGKLLTRSHRARFRKQARKLLRQLRRMSPDRSDRRL